MEIKYLFWTSGWDSTFRLLQLILLENVTVQPIYILDESRKSHVEELKAIQLIINKIASCHPSKSKYLLSPIISKKSEILEDIYIKENFNKIKNIIKIGSQYEWLAKYCKQNKLSNIDLCIEKDSIQTSLFNFINPYFSDNNNIECKNKDAIVSVFKYYNFPLFDTNKQQMFEISKKNNWLEIMELTWFCHKPKRSLPCGKCNPCKTTIMKGLGFRINFINRINGYIHIYIYDKFKN